MVKKKNAHKAKKKMFVYVARLEPGTYYFVGVGEAPSRHVANQAKTFAYLKEHPFIEIVSQEDARIPYQKHVNETVEQWKRTCNVHVCAAPPSRYANIDVPAPKLNEPVSDDECEWEHLSPTWDDIIDPAEESCDYDSESSDG